MIYFFLTLGLTLGKWDTLEKLKEEKKQMSERVNTSTMEDYDSYKTIDNEGKNLLDFVTTSVWNARKELVDRSNLFGSDKSNEVVDLFYAISNCHGWVKSTNREIRVRLEPLQQPKRLAVQEQLCRWLIGLGAKTPTGKAMVIEVRHHFRECPKK